MVGRSAAIASDRLAGVFKKYLQALSYYLPRQVLLECCKLRDADTALDGSEAPSSLAEATKVFPLELSILF